MYLTKLGFSLNEIILKSLILSKFLQYNIYTLPKLKKLIIKFPIFDSIDLKKSKLLIIILDFLETLTFCKPIIKQTKLISKTNNFYLCYIVLTKFSKNIFLENFNNFIINNFITNILNKKIKLKILNKYKLNLLIFNLDIFFDVYSKKILPKNNLFWFEFEFFFNQNLNLINFDSIFNYHQLFFNLNLINEIKK